MCDCSLQIILRILENLFPFTFLKWLVAGGEGRGGYDYVKEFMWCVESVGIRATATKVLTKDLFFFTCMCVSVPQV